MFFSIGSVFNRYIPDPTCLLVNSTVIEGISFTSNSQQLWNPSWDPRFQLLYFFWHKKIDFVQRSNILLRLIDLALCWCHYKTKCWQPLLSDTLTAASPKLLLGLITKGLLVIWSFTWRLHCGHYIATLQMRHYLNNLASNIYNWIYV